MIYNIQIYSDENSMINEIKLRQIIGDMFPEMN